MYDVAKVLLVLSILVAFAINQYVIIEMLTPGLHRKYANGVDVRFAVLY